MGLKKGKGHHSYSEKHGGLRVKIKISRHLRERKTLVIIVFVTNIPCVFRGDNFSWISITVETCDEQTIPAVDNARYEIHRLM